MQFSPFLSYLVLIRSKFWCSPFIHLAVCLTTGPKPLPKPALYIVRSRASSFKWEYPLLSLTSSSSFPRLLPRLPVTSITPCIFPSVTRCRRQFLRKMWTIQFAFRLRISCSPQVKNRGLFTWDNYNIFHLDGMRKVWKIDDHLQGFLAKGRILDSLSTWYGLQQP
jgi:hypothetical protein